MSTLNPPVLFCSGMTDPLEHIAVRFSKVQISFLIEMAQLLSDQLDADE
ncbi:hypothetical protein [Paenibacillus elgii]